MNLPKTWLCARRPLISLVLTSHLQLSITHTVNPKLHNQALEPDLSLPGLLGPPAAQLLQLSQFGSLGHHRPCPPLHLHLCSGRVPSLGALSTHTTWPHPRGLPLPQNSSLRDESSLFRIHG